MRRMDTIPGQLWTPVGWTDDSRFDGYAMPGIANLHSHAFQRAMAGLAERQSHPEDSFWTWRETMYRFAARMNPDSNYAVARQLYVEMLEAGFTSVCEFHYLHHAPDGSAYADPAAMSRALIAAARDTGIRLTLLPVLYMTGGFDGRELSERQRRFGHTIDSFLALLDILQGEQDETLRVGAAFHSLRAVPETAMQAVLAALPRTMRVHIHIAEQLGEVQDCLTLRGARPVEWLLANAPVDERWTLVHATHLTKAETLGIADAGATVAICPTTEANLGDGLFPLADYLEADGRWGIGSDSHVSVSPVEELRWLEYGQRLLTHHRNIAVNESTSVGESLLHGVVASASASTGQAAEDDIVVLDGQAPAFAGAHANDVVDRWIFAGNRPVVGEVHVAGKRVVEAGRHRDHEAVGREYQRTLRTLLADA